jgi:hypothetical protein
VQSCHESTLLCVSFAIWSTGLTAPSDEVVETEGIAGTSSWKKRLLHKPRRARGARETGDHANGQRERLFIRWIRISSRIL